jgi:hypothetical protein
MASPPASVESRCSGPSAQPGSSRFVAQCCPGIQRVDVKVRDRLLLLHRGHRSVEPINPGLAASSWNDDGGTLSR